MQNKILIARNQENLRRFQRRSESESDIDLTFK